MTDELESHPSPILLLSEEAFNRLMADIENPPDPPQALIDLMAEHWEQPRNPEQDKEFAEWAQRQMKILRDRREGLI